MRRPSVGSSLRTSVPSPSGTALAVRTGAPIYAMDALLEENAIEFEQDLEDAEDMVEKFKEFLDQVTPEDFAEGS